VDPLVAHEAEVGPGLVVGDEVEDVGARGGFRAGLLGRGEGAEGGEKEEHAAVAQSKGPAAMNAVERRTRAWRIVSHSGFRFGVQ